MKVSPIFQHKFFENSKFINCRKTNDGIQTILRNLYPTRQPTYEDNWNEVFRSEVIAVIKSGRMLWVTEWNGLVSGNDSKLTITETGWARSASEFPPDKVH